MTRIIEEKRTFFFVFCLVKLDYACLWELIYINISRIDKSMSRTKIEQETMNSKKKWCNVCRKKLKILWFCEQLNFNAMMHGEHFNLWLKSDGKTAWTLDELLGGRALSFIRRKYIDVLLSRSHTDKVSKNKVERARYATG